MAKKGTRKLKRMLQALSYLMKLPGSLPPGSYRYPEAEENASSSHISDEASGYLASIYPKASSFRVDRGE
jgi:hypothetical protein